MQKISSPFGRTTPAASRMVVGGAKRIIGLCQTNVGLRHPINEAREALEEALSVLGNYVNSIANGDPMIVEQSGFPAYETTRSPDTSAPAAPTNLRLSQGDLSGAILARYKSDRQPSTNEVQTATGDPNVEASWQTKGMFQGGRAEMSGFTPGVIIWVRGVILRRSV